MTTKFGEMNGPAIGIILKEVVRRAIVIIRQNRLTFQTTHKLGYDGISDDVYTDADKLAQKIYVKVLKECFPGYGIVAEEDSLSVPCTLVETNMYFTVDPLDGTKAFTRGQSHGIGTMISLVCNDEVIATSVGDANTQEIFYFRPNSSKVHRLFHDPEMHEELIVCPTEILARQRWLLSDPTNEYSRFAQSLFDHSEKLKFKYTIVDGSIGIKMARLWKGEVGAVILKPGIQTPWDMQPVYGISQKLGFLCLEVQMLNDKVGAISEYQISETFKKNHGELFFIHKTHLGEFNYLMRSFNEK